MKLLETKKLLQTIFLIISSKNLGQSSREECCADLRSIKSVFALRNSFLEEIIKKIGFAILFLSFLVSCATMDGDRDFDKPYFDLVDQNSLEREHNDGLYNIFSIKIVRHTSDLLLAQLNKKNADNKWSEKFFNEERTKILDKQKNESEIFVSFFAAKRKHDDLDLGASIWKIYLEMNGKRYPGKLSKYSSVYEQIRSYYPSHTQWATPYIATFDLPTAEITNPSKFIITGSLGEETLEFK